MNTTTRSPEEMAKIRLGLKAVRDARQAEYREKFKDVPDEAVEKLEARLEHGDLWKHQTDVIAAHRNLRGQFGLSPEHALQVAATSSLMEHLDGVRCALERTNELLEALLRTSR